MSKPRFTASKSKAKAAGTPKPKVAQENMPQSPEQLEAVLAALLAPETAQIEQATLIMNQFLKHAAAVPALMQQIAQSTNPLSRQMAAVLLRRVICKLWKNIPQADQEQVVSHNTDDTGRSKCRSRRHAASHQPPRRQPSDRAVGRLLHC